MGLQVPWLPSLLAREEQIIGERRLAYGFRAQLGTRVKALSEVR